jgi:hypothetical protein
MEDSAKLIESLLEKVSDYGETSLELVKLKTIDKTTEVVSTMVPHIIVFLFIVCFLLFLTTAFALWLGEILGKIFYGFFIASAFYILMGIVIHFFLHKRIKKFIGDYFIKLVLK